MKISVFLILAAVLALWAGFKARKSRDLLDYLLAGFWIFFALRIAFRLPFLVVGSGVCLVLYWVLRCARSERRDRQTKEIKEMKAASWFPEKGEAVKSLREIPEKPKTD